MIAPSGSYVTPESSVVLPTLMPATRPAESRVIVTAVLDGNVSEVILPFV